MDTFLTILGIIAAGAGAAGAWGAWFAARAANRTSSSVAEIERGRRHTELTPQFAINITRTAGDDENATIYFELVGPPGLGDLDEVRASIRNDSSDGLADPRLANDPTPEQVAEYVWGPYMFSPRINGAPQDGKWVEPFPLRMGDRTRRQLSRSRVPFWTSSEWWRQRFDGQPVRLAMECRRDGWEPWTVIHVVEVTPPAER